MAIVNQYKRAAKGALPMVDYLTALLAISTFTMLSFRGLIFTYHGLATILIWAWLVILLLFLVRLSWRVLDIKIFHIYAVKIGLIGVLESSALPVVTLLVTTLVICNIVFGYVPFT